MLLSPLLRSLFSLIFAALLVTGCVKDTNTGGDEGTDSDTGVDSDAGSDADEPAITELITVPGPDNDLASDHLPIIWPADPDETDYEDLDGFFVGFRHAIVLATPDATVAQINAALSTTDAAITGALPGGRVLEFRLDTADTAELAVALSQLAALPGIASAAPDFSLLPDALPPNNPDPQARYRWDTPTYPAGPFDHGNWGLEAIRAPQLWNFDTFVQRVRAGTTISAGVFDAGFTEAVSTPSSARHPGFRRANGSAVLQLVNSGVNDHGTHVAGIIGAPWDNGVSVTGVDPWLNAIHGRAHVFKEAHTTWRAQLASLAQLITQNPDVRAINNSYGLSFYFRQGDRLNDPDRAGSFQPSVVAFGEYGGRAPKYNVGPFDLDNNGRADTWREVVKRAGDYYANDPTIAGANCMIVSSAGNATGLYLAADNSPINSAAEHHGRHFLSVESARLDNTISSFSQVGGSIAAPGECIRSTEAVETVPPMPGDSVPHNADADACDWGDTNDPLYSTNRGTSMAAPHVTGLITALARLEPSLTVAQMRTLVAGDNATTATNGTRRIDAFAAALDIDRLKGTKALQTALVDIDDGTIDGNERQSFGADGVAMDSTAMNNADRRRGDGKISMADFRTYRDALAQVIAAANPSANVFLGGSPHHFKRDLNFDGCIGTAPVNPPHPAGTVPIPADCANTPAESVFARHDFNADGTLGHDRIAFAQNDWRDIDVLMDLWQDGDQDATEGWARADLPRLLPSMDGRGGSADLIIRAEIPLTSPQAPYDEIKVRVDGASGERVMDSGTPELLWTVPRVGGLSAVRATGFKNGIELDELCAQDDLGAAPLAIAEDRLVRLVECGDSGMNIDESRVYVGQSHTKLDFSGLIQRIDLEAGPAMDIELVCPSLPVDGACLVERALPYEYATGTISGHVVRTAQDAYTMTLSADLDPQVPPLADLGDPGCGGLFNSTIPVLCESFALTRVRVRLTVQTEIDSQAPMRIKCGIEAESTVIGAQSGNTFADPPRVEIGGAHGSTEGPSTEINGCFQSSLDTHENRLDWDQTTIVPADPDPRPGPRHFTLRLTAYAASGRLVIPDDDQQTQVHLFAEATAEIDLP